MSYAERVHIHIYPATATFAVVNECTSEHNIYIKSVLTTTTSSGSLVPLTNDVTVAMVTAEGR